TATRARLGRVGRIDLDDLATSTFSLVREMGDKVGPTCIQDAHGETAGHHGGNPEIFEHDPIEPRDQFVDELVEEVFPRVGHMNHHALQSQDQPATVAAPEHASCDLSLQDAQLLENPAIPPRVLFLLAIAERGQPHQPKIDADRCPGLRQRFGLLDRAGEGDEPLACSAEDTGRLDRPFELAVPADGDPADAGEVKATALPSILPWAHLEAVAVLLEAEPRESVPGLEPGVAGILAGLDPAEERLERLVQIGHDVLKDVAVDVQRVGTGRFLHLDLAQLHGLGDCLASFLVSLFSLAAASIVEVTACLAHGFQPSTLALAGIQAIDECLEHLLGVRFLCCLANKSFKNGRLGGSTPFGHLQEQFQGRLGKTECPGDLFVLHAPIVRRHIAKSNMDGLKPFRINPPDHGLKPRGLRRVPSVSYSCPHCQVLLEVPDKPWRGWVLCPDCGLPCLPPERLTLPHSRKRSVARQPQVPQDLVPEQTGARKEPAPMVKPSVPRARQSTSSSATRLIVSTGLFVSAILLRVAYLDRSSHSLAIFGTLTVIFLILLLRMPRRR